jgi:hypothetical protein
MLNVVRAIVAFQIRSSSACHSLVKPKGKPRDAGSRESDLILITDNVLT